MRREVMKRYRCFPSPVGRFLVAVTATADLLYDTIAAMTTERIPPTPAQQRLVNIGLLIQFHLAAIGHLVVWVWAFGAMLKPHVFDWGEMPPEAVVYVGIPISFGILVAVYIIFRCLLADANFGTALIFMIIIDVLHALIMCVTIIVPARLIIPIVLYSIALYHYRTTWLCAQLEAREER